MMLMTSCDNITPAVKYRQRYIIRIYEKISLPVLRWGRIFLLGECVGIPLFLKKF